MWGELLVVMALAAACAGWVLLQRWIARVDPDVQSLFERGCGGCSGHCDRSGESCSRSGASRDD